MMPVCAGHSPDRIVEWPGAVSVTEILVAVGEERAFVGELCQAAAELAFPAGEIVGPHLIDRDHHDQFWPRWRRWRSQQTRQEGERDGEIHEPQR